MGQFASGLSHFFVVWYVWYCWYRNAFVQESEINPPARLEVWVGYQRLLFLM